MRAPAIANPCRRIAATRSRRAWLDGSADLLAGCGEPSVRELKNRRELEALLTAISLKNQKELDKDIKRIDERHASGELSDDGYKDLQEISRKPRPATGPGPRNRRMNSASRSRISSDSKGGLSADEEVHLSRPP